MLSRVKKSVKNRKKPGPKKGKNFQIFGLQMKYEIITRVPWGSNVEIFRNKSQTSKFRIQDFRKNLRFRSVSHEHNLCPLR